MRDKKRREREDRWKRVTDVAVGYRAVSATTNNASFPSLLLVLFYFLFLLNSFFNISFSFSFANQKALSTGHRHANIQSRPFRGCSTAAERPRWLVVIYLLCISLTPSTSILLYSIYCTVQFYKNMCYVLYLYNIIQFLCSFLCDEVIIHGYH